MLPLKAIEEYKKDCYRNYGIQLSDSEASKLANNLVALYKAVYGPDKIGRIGSNDEIKRCNTSTL